MDISQVWPEWHEDCVLGEGSFGKVYKAKRVEKGRTFFSAIKVLTVPKSSQEVKQARNQGMSEREIHDYFESFVDDLLTEITLMENLKSAQNIVQIDDYKIMEHTGDIGWDIFIRMELLTPFDSFINDPNFSQLEVIKLGINICTALEVCEQNSIIHRDIKPDNIFVSRFGEYKLGDFGIAKQLDKTQANLSRKGTLNFMAPEVYQGIPYGSSVDIYSLGLVLYTLLNNNRTAFMPPYPQQITYNDNETALTKRLSGEPMPYPCNASPNLGYIVCKACAYRPEDRYQTASEFKNALFTELSSMSMSGQIPFDMGSMAGVAPTSSGVFLNHTTNDMTAHGRMLVNEYGDGTTLLDGGMNGYNDGTTVLGGGTGGYGDGTTILNGGTNGFNDGTTVLGGNDAGYPQPGGGQDAEPEEYKKGGVYIPGSEKKQKGKSSKVCKIIAYPLLAAAIIWSFISLRYVGVLMVSTVLFAVTVLLADNNKYPVGIAMAGVSVFPLIQQIIDFTSGVEAFNLSNMAFIVYAVAYLLAVLSGAAILIQKEVRFGGTLALYSAAAMVVSYFVGMRDMEMLIYALLFAGVFMWTYGYSSTKKEENTVKKILSLAAFAPAAAVLIMNLIYRSF